MADIIEQRITPEKPRIIDHQEVKVYVPTVSANQKGIASFDNEDFIIDNKGKVSARNSIRVQRQYADPLHNPQQMAEIGIPGKQNENSVSLVKLLDIEFEHVEAGEYGFDPRSEKGVLRLNRTKLSKEGLNKPSLVLLNEDDFLQIVMPVTGYTRSDIKWPTYPFNDAPSNVVEDTERKLGFSMDYRYFGLTDPDGKVVKPLLPRASEWSEALEQEKGFGAVRIDQRVGGYNPWLHFVTRLPANNDPTSTDGLMDLAFREDTLGRYIQNELDFSRIVTNYSPDGDIDILNGYVIPDPKDPYLARKLAYIANFVKPDMTVVSTVDGKEYTNGAQLPFGETYDSETMFQRTLLLLNKEAIGLGRIPNLDPLNWPISNPVREILEILQGGTEFGKKKDEIEYINDIGLTYETSVNPTTVKQRIANLEQAVDGMTQVHAGFLGYITVPEGENVESYLNTNYPVTTPGFDDLTNVFVTNTNTLWGWTEDGWMDTEVNLIRGDEFQYKLNGVIKSIKVVSGQTKAGTEDFKVTFDNSLLELEINIPYVAESKYFHNWLGQLPNGVENFEKGHYKKFWIGTKAQYAAEFIAPPDEDVITMITDDVTNFEGDVVDGTRLENRVNDFASALLSGTQVGRRYVIKPVVGGSGLAPKLQGWGVEEWVPEKFVQIIVDPIFNDGITNIVGQGNEETGILRYNGQSFALVPPGLSTNIDPLLGVSYKGLKETVKDTLSDVILGRTGVRAGSYITLPDLQNNFGNSTNNKPLFNHLLDSGYQVVNYPNWKEGTPGAMTSTAFIQNSISKLWSAILAIDTTNGQQDLKLTTINTKLAKYPDPVINAANGGNYVFTIANTGNPTNMYMTKLSTIIGTTPLSELVNINTWTHGTGGNTVAATAMTAANFASMFAIASQVKYKKGSDNSINNILFWVGTKAQYTSIATKNSNTLYICTDGAIYFGTNLLGERTITTSTVVSEMNATQVQTLLNKLPQV